MIRFYDMPQGSEEWDEIRKGKLTASQFDKVFSSKTLKIARLIKDPSDNELAVMLKRAKKQAEVVQMLREGEQESSGLNASGLKGVIEKGFCEVYESKDGCSLLSSSTAKHIDLLIAQTIYTSAELGEIVPNYAMERGNDLESSARLEFEINQGIDVEEVGFAINPSISTMIGCSPDGMVDNRKGGYESKCPLPQTHIGYLRHGGLPPEYRAQVHGCMAVTEAEYWWFTSYCPGLPTLTIKVMRSDYTENMVKSLKEFSARYEEQVAELKLLQLEE